MPNLGDYLGLLVSEATIGRMQADLEAIRIADLYASHPLLKHMPVPRFRVPDIELDVPVVIDQVENAASPQLPRGGLAAAAAKDAMAKAMASTFAKNQIELTPQLRDKVLTSLEQRASSGVGAQPFAPDVTKLAQDLAAEAANAALPLPAATKKAAGGAVRLTDEAARKRDTLQSDLANAAALEFLRVREPPPRLNTLVTSQDVRNAGANVVRIKLRITEQSVEWTNTDAEDKTSSKLVPE